MKQPPVIYPQGSFEWFRERWGRITMSSSVKTLMEGTTGQLNGLLKLIRWQISHAGSDDVIREEWIREGRLGDRVEAMAWGRRYEMESIRQYELSRGVDVIRPGFTAHPDWPELVGTSADFIELDEDGEAEFVGEVKCPHKSERHKQYLQYGMPPDYFHQTQGHMEVYGLQFGKFVSYDPRHPLNHDKIYVQVLQRDEAWSMLFREKMTEFARHIKKGTDYTPPLGDVSDGVPQLF